MPTAWIFLLLAGMSEIGWAVGLKYTEGFTRLWPSIGTVAAMIVSLVCLGQSLRGIPIGTAYAVWTGIGAVGVACYGILYLAEPATALRVGCLLLILIGVIGLKIVPS
jgi:quaternary ammonium compound-resistance protein SugE